MTDSITLAVLRPTPGMASRESMSAGTCPACRLDMARAIPIRDLVLLLGYEQERMRLNTC